MARRAFVFVVVLALAGCLEFVEEPAPEERPADQSRPVAAPTPVEVPVPEVTLPSITPSPTTAPSPPDDDTCRTEAGRDVRAQTSPAQAVLRSPGESAFPNQSNDTIGIMGTLGRGGFALLIEPGWEQAQAWIALGEEETNSNAGWKQPIEQTVDGTAFLALVEEAHCGAVRDALAQALPADAAVHLRTLRPGASYAPMGLAWDGAVPADGTWLLVKTDDVMVTRVVLGGRTVDRSWEEESEWDLGPDGAAFRWDFLTVGGDKVCFDDATGSDHFARCGDPTAQPFQAFGAEASAGLRKAYDALAAGQVPMAYCRGEPCTRWADRLQDIRVATTDSTATVSWLDVAGLPPSVHLSLLDSASLQRGTVNCLCWSAPTLRDGRWSSTLTGLAGDTTFAFDFVHGNPLTAVSSGSFRTQPATLGLDHLTITGRSTQVMFDFVATGSGPLQATGHWTNVATGAHGQTSPGPGPQGRFQFGAWLTDEDELPGGTYEAHVVLVDGRGERIESARVTFTV